MSTENQKKAKIPQIIRLDKAFKLAEQWVNNMSKDVEAEKVEVEPEGRPLKLGLGAKVARQLKVGPFNDPVERKLHAKLEAGRRKAAEESLANGNDNEDDDEDSDGELESRTNAFTKKRGGPSPPSSHLQVKKKQK